MKRVLDIARASGNAGGADLHAPANVVGKKSVVLRSNHSDRRVVDSCIRMLNAYQK